ncbi:flavin reductase family protein [uncultured Friedmanniella sp.]|uniref:flavin reductase family protein n=1 Tax=uncultured Friedmanniella sp. TaxID=335381 RepID=UPI0035C9B9A8
MTIHPEHPFLPGDGDRDPVRRWRGRMPAPVSVWTTHAAPRPVGWTVSSFVLADGQPPEVVGLVDEESDFADALALSGRFAVNLLGWSDRALADVFAGLAPAPGGAFTVGSWSDSEWGPVLDGGAGWLGVRAVGPYDHAGWGLLVRGVVEHVELGALPDAGVLTSFRGRYGAAGASLGS